METKQTFWQTIVCPACLCVNRKLQNITDHNEKEYYFNTLCEIPSYQLSEKDLRICWECLAVLKRAVSFREQVKDSYRVLQRYTKEDLLDCLLTDISRPPRLIIRSFSPVDIVSHEDTGAYGLDNYEIKIEENPLETRKEHRRNTYSKDVKSENDYSSLDNEDFGITHNGDVKEDSKEVITSYEHAVGFVRHHDEYVGDNVKMKKEKVNRSRVEKAKKMTKRKLSKNNKLEANGKMRTIELSYDQVLSERTKDSQREVFLKAPFKCETCILGFDCEKSYKEHNSDKHSMSKGDYNCPVCKIVFETVEAFTTHYKLHIRRYECGSCDKRTVDRKSMKDHYYTVHEVRGQKSGLTKEYKCNFCGKLSRTIDSHRYHRDTHKKRAECKDCDKTFSHRSGLMNHRLTVHKKNRGFPCSVCNKIFRWKASMKRHMEKHEERKNEDQVNTPYCDQCNVYFSSVCSYKRHMKNSLKHVTEDELKYICADCNRKFANKTKLRDHIEEKHLRKTYQCQICLKPSKNRVCLDQHIRNVHNGRPRNKICHHCGKGFPTRVQLESHIRSHTGEKPFICEYCPTTFSQKSNLYKHNRQVHMNIKAKRYAVCRKRKDRQELEHGFSVSNVHFSHGLCHLITNGK